MLEFDLTFSTAMHCGQTRFDLLHIMPAYLLNSLRGGRGFWQTLPLIQLFLHLLFQVSDVEISALIQFPHAVLDVQLFAWFSLLS